MLHELAVGAAARVVSPRCPMVDPLATPPEPQPARRLPAGPAAVERGAGRHRPHRARVHPEPLRAGALRGGAEGGRRHRGGRPGGPGGPPGGRPLRPGVARSRWAAACPATSPPRWPWAPSWATTRAKILLVQRADSGVWLYPTGWADVGYSPAEVALKEVEEETGIAVRAGAPPGRARRHAHGATRDAAVLAGVPLPGHRRRARTPTRWSAPTWAGSGPTSCPSRPSARSRWRRQAFAAIRGSRSSCCSTPLAPDLAGGPPRALTSSGPTEPPAQS